MIEFPASFCGKSFFSVIVVVVPLWIKNRIGFFERCAKTYCLEVTKGMHFSLQILGLEEHMAGLKIIHVAGTKGKVHFFLCWYRIAN